MTQERCRRFDTEGFIEDEDLTAEQRAHIANCPDCQAKRDSAQRIVAELPQLGELNPLPAGARERLWEALDRDDSEHARGRRRLIVTAGLSLAAAAVIVFLLLRPPPLEPLLRYEAIVGNNIVRTGNAFALGDRLRVHTGPGARPNVDLRIYRDRTALAARRVGPGPLTLELELAAPGSYEIVLLHFESASPSDPKSVDEDIAAAVRSGIAYELREVEVR